MAYHSDCIVFHNMDGGRLCFVRIIIVGNAKFTDKKSDRIAARKVAMTTEKSNRKTALKQKHAIFDWNANRVYKML